MTNGMKSILFIAGLGLFLATGTASASMAFETLLVDKILEWGTIQHRLRTDKSLPDPEKCFALKQKYPAGTMAPPAEQALISRCLNRESLRLSGVAAGTEAQILINQLRPEFKGPPRARQSEVNQYVLNLVRKYKPDQEPRLRIEFNQLLVINTKVLLETIRAGLEGYIADNGIYPDSGNLNLAKALVSKSDLAHVRLPKSNFDESGRIVDAWGAPTIYERLSATQYSLYSVGPNGKDESGNGDDIKVSK